MKKLFAMLTILINFLISQNIVFAQETQVNLSVSPPVSYLHVAPGTSASHTILLENNGDSPITVLPTIVDFTTDGKSGRAILTNQLTFPYISMGEDDSAKEVTIPPKKKAQLTLLIDVPKEAEEKEYPLTVLFFSNSKLDNSNIIQKTSTKSQITGAIGSNLIVLVAKQNKFEKFLEVIDLDFPKIIDSFQKVEFTPLVKNNSFGAATASGSAKIVNWRKQTIAEFEIYPDTILGHNSRELRAILSKSDQENPEVGSFSYKPKFLIGPYQIVVNLDSQNNQTISQEIYVFYALPLAIIFAGVVGTAIYIYFSKTKHE